MFLFLSPSPFFCFMSALLKSCRTPAYAHLHFSIFQSTCMFAYWVCICVYLLHTFIDFPSKSMHILPLLLPSCHNPPRLPTSGNTHYVSKPHKPRPWSPLFWITHSLCCRSQTAWALSCLEWLIFALIIAILSTNEVKRRLKARIWSLCAATADFACSPRQLRSMGLRVCVLNRNAEGEGEEIFEERASESGNYSLTPPPPHNPSTRPPVSANWQGLCLETNSAPKAQPVWYAVQSDGEASGQKQTQQRHARPWTAHTCCCNGTLTAGTLCTRAANNIKTYIISKKKEGSLKGRGRWLANKRVGMSRHKKGRHIWNPVHNWSIISQ